MLKDILTGINGNSYAIVKVLGFLVVMVFLGLEVFAVVMGRAFDAQAYGIGGGAAIAAMGAAIKLTETSEPKQ